VFGAGDDGQPLPFLGLLAAAAARAPPPPPPGKRRVRCPRDAARLTRCAAGFLPLRTSNPFIGGAA
jgi:hypothetical protein